MILVSLRDNKAETWSLPHPVHNKAVALREFAALVNAKDGSIVSCHPADFDLFLVGAGAAPFNGKLDLVDNPEHLANGLDVKMPE